MNDVAGPNSLSPSTIQFDFINRCRKLSICKVDDIFVSNETSKNVCSISNKPCEMIISEAKSGGEKSSKSFFSDPQNTRADNLKHFESPRKRRYLEERSSKCDDFEHEMRRSRRARHFDGEFHGANQESFGVESQIAQQQLSQMIENGYTEQIQFNQFMNNQVALLQSLQKKSKRKKENKE